MVSPDLQSPQLIPSWIFEQDYLVFLSFFGWVLVGLLAWTKPLSENEGRGLPWLWIGYYAFSQAISDFLRTLSFSDPFFRNFNLEVGFEMLGYGLLVEIATRYANRNRERSFFPFAAVGGLCLGLSIEVGDVLYTLVVSFLSSVLAIILASRSFLREARDEKRRELYAVVAGLILVLPTWLLAPDRLSSVLGLSTVAYEDFPYYGLDLLSLRILAAWTMLAGFWYYRLQRRIEDVAEPIGDQLKLLGYRILPLALCLIGGASYLVTSWNGERARDRLAEDYLSRAETAALSMDAGDFTEYERRDESDRQLVGALASQLQAIKRIGPDARSVYLWVGDETGVHTIAFEKEQQVDTLLLRVAGLLEDSDGFRVSEAFALGPISVSGKSVLHISAPVLEKRTGELAFWLGIDLDGSSWFQSVSLSRLQTIIIAGLILALVIFFLYYQIDHESEADLVLAKGRAEAADRAKSEFLAVISHEIRTPLQSVLGYSDLLRSTPLNEKQHSCVDTIQTEGKILLRIVQDILDFSNLRKANFELQTGQVRLHRLIEETFRTIKPMADRKGLSASLEIADDVPTLVLADGVRLRQVLLNLFGNSVKYTEKGSVRLRAYVEKEPQEDERPLPLRFEISDTGLGIRKEDLARLFQPFVQLQHEGTSPREGAGLGLAIVNRIIELMGGRIAVSSEHGVGSTFTVRFDFEKLADEYADDDIAAPRPTQSSIQEEASLGRRYPLKIMVVDDNPMVRRLMLQYLDSLGYEAHEFKGGRPAAAHGHEYDLAILDLRMPGVDGPQAASAIREKSGNAQRPWIIAVSASLQENEVKRARDAGVNDFLGKPFFAGQLSEKIRAIPWFEEMEVEEALVEEEEESEPEHVPIFIGPAEVETVVEEPSYADESKPTMPDSVFGGADGYPPEVVKAAIAEVYSKHGDMKGLAREGNWAAVREEAHYIANTAMALGIDQLYLDAKSLETAAEKADAASVEKWLEELMLNFEAWEKE